MGRKHVLDRYLEGKWRKVQILSGLDARKIDVFDFLRILSLGFRVGRARIGSVRHGFGSKSDSETRSIPIRNQLDGDSKIDYDLLANLV